MARLPDIFTSPEGLGFVSTTVRSITKTMTNELNSGETLSVQIAGQVWEINVSFPESLSEDSDSNITRAFLAGVKGRLNEFQIVLPDKIHPRNASFPNTTGTSIDGGQSGSTLVIKDWHNALAAATMYTANSAGGYIAPNDYFKLSTHPKVYKVLGSTYNTSTKELTLDIFPNLTITTTGLEKPIFNDLEWNVKLTSDELTESIDVDGVCGSFTISMRETY